MIRGLLLGHVAERIVLSTRIPLRWLLIAPAILVAANALAAKPNVTRFQLEFTPQQTVAAAEMVLHPSLRENPVRLRFVDERSINDLSVVGSRTDDDDRLFDLNATNEVLPFIEQVLVRRIRDWGVTVEEDAELMLTIGLRQFTVHEANEAVGATYAATVRIAGDLQNRSGGMLWSGSSLGDALWDGKKFSNPRCNEVLSDALLKAWSRLLSHSRLHDAWGGKVKPREASGVSDSSAGTGGDDSDSVSATDLLKEVKALMEQGLESQTIIDYVSQQTLSARLHSDDLLDWKRAGVEEEVLRAVLKLSVR